MDKKLRPLRWPRRSASRDIYRDMIRQVFCLSLPEARKLVRELNQDWRNVPMPGELCEAKTRRGTPCKALALANGRCPLHGGLSTGPRTPEGKRRALANLELGPGRLRKRKKLDEGCP